MKKYLNIMVAISLMAFVSQSLAASGTSSWTNLFPGIDHAVGWADGTGGDPHLKINCMRIDLANPNIEFVATPHTGWGETMTQKTGDFLVEHNVQIAINAQSGSPADGGDWVPRWDQDYESDPSGALVSQGSISSPEDTWCQELRIDRNNQATILQQPDMAWPYNPGTPVLDSNVWTAICGYRMVLTNGVVVFGETGDEDAYYYTKSPQQSIGLSQDGHYLYLTTVDGRQPGVSEGLTMHDFGLWLLDFGVYEAIMLSGGGSATMVKSDGAGGYDFVGIPVGSPYVAHPYDERHLPANFGVRSLPPGSRAWNAVLGDWATSANWDTGTLPYKPDDVAITNGGTARITQAGACSNLILGAAGNGTLELVGGDTVVGGDAFLTVVGGYNQAATGTLVARIDSNGLAAVEVDGVANLGGTLAVADDGALGLSYTVLRAAGGISGTFDVVDLPAGWDYAVGSGTLTVSRPAIPIAVADGSFENVTTANWDYLPTTGTGWVADDANESFAAKSSVYHPGYSISYPQPTPAGSYFCDLYASSIHQAVAGQTYAEGYTYTLTYWAAAGTASYNNELSAYFTDGDANGGAYPNNVVASTHFYFHEDAVWREYKLGYTATAADHGKTIGIAFKGYWYTHVDNVSLAYVPAEDGPDGDGLPYWWEMQYYGGPTNADPSAWAANGANSVLDAYVAGFDPTNSLAGFGVADFVADAGLGHYVLQWDEAAGRVYSVYWTTNLTDGFSVVLTNNYAAGIFTDTVHNAESEGFYRLEVEVAP